MGHPLKPGRPAGRPRWKLWHFTVIVLAAALVFATIRALSGEPNGPIDGLYSLVVLAIAGLAPLGLIMGGRKVAGWATSGLKDWGVRRGGMFGFTAWLVGISVEVGYYLASIVVGPVAAIAVFLWLARLVGG